jgi:UDP-N-acetylmuramate--alanine ligase
VPGEVARRARPGDVVVTMGAPPISLMGDEVIAALAAASSAASAPSASSAPAPAPAEAASGG